MARWCAKIFSYGPKLYCFFAFVINLCSETAAIKCYICGQTNLPSPGECTSQFQFDCSSNDATSQRGGSSKMLCRTTRSKIGENLFSVGKECISERDHLTRYPDGKTVGCGVLDKNGRHELNYCVCDTDICNLANIDKQINEHYRRQHPNAVIATDPIVPATDESLNGSLHAEPSTDHLSSQGQQQTLPALRRFPNDKAAQTTKPLISIKYPDRISNVLQLQPAAVVNHSVANGDNATDHVFPQQVQSHQMIVNSSAESFLCMMCAESNMQNGSTHNECHDQVEVDCVKLFNGQSNLFCLTKSTTLSSGRYAIEKRCASAESLAKDLGAGFAKDACSQSSNEPLIAQYCVCSVSKCNKLSLYDQMAANSPTTVTSTGQTVSSRKVVSDSNIGIDEHFCYACTETNLAQPTDCTRQFENNCKHPTEDNAKMLCLTRQTKMANGLFSIEKRCISELEHKQQYPGFSVVMNGCGDAWNGLVQYCVCSEDFCNRRNISSQQGAVTKNKETVTLSANIIGEFSTLTVASTGEVGLMVEHRNGSGTKSSNVWSQDKLFNKQNINDKKNRNPNKVPKFHHNHNWSLLLSFVIVLYGSML